MRYAILFALAIPALARQDNTSDASVARASKLAAEGRVPPPDEIRVYDFINFHRHELREPAADEAVALDVRFLRDAAADGPTEAAIQIGIRTHRPSRRARPINLALVIDRSGSMADAHKMEYVKDALDLLVRNLTEDDVLAVVVYSDEAAVLRGAARVSDPDAVRAQIRAISPGGSTNLHAGLMLGYEEALKHLDPKRANKVVLLSDGLANHGVTDPERIVAESKDHNGKGIDLSTVGIGLNYNDKLMNQLAEAGRGTYHFLDSADGIRRVFEKELVSLLDKVAREPVLTVRLGRGATLKDVYGYAVEQPDDRTLRIRLLDLPLALTQIVPIELSLVAERDEIVATARLEYVDVASGRPAAVEREARLRRLEAGKEGPCDADVLKNFAIARLAQALHDACRCGHNMGDWPKAKALLAGAVREVEVLFGPGVKDADLLKVLEIARQTLKALGV